MAETSAAAIADHPPPFRRAALLLGNRNFVLLWAAYGISALGDHLSEMGLLKLQNALDPGVTDTTRRQAVMTFVFMFPFFVLGPLAGWLADRLPRKWIMVAADVIRAAIMFEMLAILTRVHRWMEPAGADDAPLSLGVAVLPLVLVGVFAAFFSPARSALLPTLILPDQLVRANALTAGLGMLATIASAVLGGWLVEAVGVNANFRLDALTFVVSAMLLLAIRPPASQAVAPSSQHGLSAMADGFRYVRRHGRVAEIIVIAAVLWTAASIVRSVIPTIVKVVFGGGYADVGLYQGLLGLGLLAGSVVLTLIGPALRSELAAAWSLKLAGLAGGLMTLAVWLKLGRGLCAAGLFGVGFFGAGIQVSVNALLQRLVPNYVRGRVFGVHDVCTMAGLLLATGLLGIPQWPAIDRQIVPIMAATSLALFVSGVWTTMLRLKRGRFGRSITFWKNINEFYCRLWPRARREGLCTIPVNGPVIVAANHSSSLDPFLLTATSPNRFVSFMIAREFATIPVFRWLVEMIECVPVNRSGIDTASIKGALRHLDQGRVLGIFPQGRIQRPGDSVDLREGVGMLALRSGATVVPAYIRGVDYSDSVLTPFLRRQRAVVRYGPPVDLSRWRGRERDRDAYREATEEIWRAIEALRQSSTAPPR